MHFPVLIFHESFQVDNLLVKYYQDADEDDGGVIEFVKSISAKEAEKNFKKYLKKNPQDADKYDSLDSWMNAEDGYELKDGHYGYTTNLLGLYDYYEIGGRYANILPDFSEEEELEKLVKKALNLKNKKVYETFRDDMPRYVELSEMHFKAAAVELQIGGTNSILVSNNLTPDTILDYITSCFNVSGGEQNTRTEIFDKFFENIILEENALKKEELITGMKLQKFIDLYNYYANLNKKEKDFV